jgi:hypothetical protein
MRSAMHLTVCLSDLSILDFAFRSCCRMAPCLFTPLVFVCTSCLPRLASFILRPTLVVRLFQLSSLRVLIFSSMGCCLPSIDRVRCHVVALLVFSWATARNVFAYAVLAYASSRTALTHAVVGCNVSPSFVRAALLCPNDIRSYA